MELGESESTRFAPRDLLLRSLQKRNGVTNVTDLVLRRMVLTWYVSEPESTWECCWKPPPPPPPPPPSTF